MDMVNKVDRVDELDEMQLRHRRARLFHRRGEALTSDRGGNTFRRWSRHPLIPIQITLSRAM